MPTSNLSDRQALGRIRYALCGLALLFVSSLPEVARAAEENRDFQEHYQRAMALYKLRLFRQSTKEFVAAYALNPLPRLLYNLGQLLRKIGEYKEAVEAYELYLRTEIDLPRDRRAEVQGYVDALRVEAQTTTVSRPLLLGDSGGSSSSGAAGPLLLSLPAEPELKAGRFMLNIHIGYGFPIFETSNVPFDGFTLRPEFGVAVTPSRNGYIVFSPSVQIGGSYAISVPIGFQYDFPVAVRGLFIYLRGSIGYATNIYSNNSSGTPNTVVTHWGTFEPEAGIKYVLRTRINLAFEPISVPIYFNGDGASGSYRLLFNAGYNF